MILACMTKYNSDDSRIVAFGATSVKIALMPLSLVDSRDCAGSSGVEKVRARYEQRREHCLQLLLLVRR